MTALNAKAILAALPQSATAQFAIDVFAEIDSTNEFLLNHSPLAQQTWQVCLAEYQTAGRGQRGRQWFSPKQQNIHCSVRRDLTIAHQALDGLSLVIGLAMIAVLRTLIDETKLKLKYPNDVLYDQQKLAGILIETKPINTDAIAVVVGVGLNVNVDQVDTRINQAWTSLKKITDQTFNRNPLVASLLTVMVDYWQRFSEQGLAGFSTELEAYRAESSTNSRSAEPV